MKTLRLISLGLIFVASMGLLFTGGCFGPPDPLNDKDGNGMDDREDGAWNLAEWSLAALSLVVPGAAAVGATVQAIRKTREVTVMKRAATVQYRQADRLIEKLPEKEQAAEKKVMEQEQKVAGVLDIVKAAKPIQ